MSLVAPRRLGVLSPRLFLNGVEGHDGLRTTAQDNLTTGRVPHRRSQIAAAGVRVRVKLDLRCSVIVVIASAQCGTRGPVQVHRCPIRDDSTLLRACHGCLKRSSGGEQGEAQRGLHGL